MNESHSAPNELWQYVDGTLEGSSRLRVQRHLDTCKLCREQLRVAGRLDSALRTAAPGGPDTSFTNRVMERVAGAATASSHVVRFGAFIAYGTSAVIVMSTIVGVFWLTGGSSAGSSTWERLSGTEVVGELLQAVGKFTGWIGELLTGLPSIAISGSVASVVVVVSVTAGLLAILDRFFLPLLSGRGRPVR